VLKQRHYIAFNSLGALVALVKTLFLRRRIKPPRVQKGNLLGVARKNVAHIFCGTTRRVAARQTLATPFWPQSVHLERFFVVIINKRKVVICHIATGGAVTIIFY
jgi:hypothetical protein